MKDLIKGAVFGAVVTAVATVGVRAVIGFGGEPQHSVVRAMQADRAAAAANPRCAPRPVKMPCFQSGSGS